MTECRFFSTSSLALFLRPRSSVHLYIKLMIPINSRDLRAHTVCWKRPVSSCCLAWLLTTVDANKAEVCSVLFAKTSKKNEAPVHQDLMMTWKTWTMWRVHFTEIIGGELTTLTVAL